jgi:dolichyl-diphosphooligosaccharide--protein glycosyltransferase
MPFDSEHDSPILSAWQMGLVCLLAYVIVVVIHIAEFPRWDQPQLQFNGETLLATNDGYAWVAGSEGALPEAARQPMAEMLAAISHLSGVKPAVLAFWLPPFLAGLCVIPVVLWAFRLGAATMALPAAVLVSLAPAFYTRTRLGYFDTDWATMTFPLFIAWLLSFGVLGGTPERARSGGHQPERRSLFAASAAMLVLLPASIPWHAFIGLYATAALGAVMIFTLLPVGRDGRSVVLPTLCAFGLSLSLGWTGAILGMVVLIVVYKSSAFSENPWLVALSALVLVALLLGLGFQQFHSYLLSALARYLPTRWLALQTSAPAGQLLFPSVAGSIQETRHVGFLDLLTGLAFVGFLGALGCLGFILVVLRRPVALLLSPLFLIGLSSVWMGSRFGMFGIAPIWLGLAVPSGWLIQHGLKVGGKWSRAAAVPLLLTAASIPAVYVGYQELPVEAVLSRGHAQALADLGSKAGAEGVVWTWWDYGYAADHFTRLPSLANGGRNSGAYLVILGVALGSQTAGPSAEMMRFTAASGGVLGDGWTDWDEKMMAEWMAAPGVSSGQTASSEPPQYLVTSWDALALLPWIQYYGSWDFERGTGTTSSVVLIVQPKALDLGTGMFQSRNGASQAVASVDVPDGQDSLHYDYLANEGGPHLLLNRASNSVALLNDAAYQSMLVQLLIRPVGSDSPGGDFDLVVDRAPFARVYRLAAFKGGAAQ